MPTKLQEKQEEFEAKAKALHDIFEKYPDLDMPEDVAKSIKPMNDELTDLSKEVEELKSKAVIAENVQKILDDAGSRQEPMQWQKGRKGQPVSEQDDGKTIGQRIMESKAITGYEKGSGIGPACELDAKGLFERKTVFDTSTGYAPQAIRIGKLVDYAAERPMVVDLIPQGTTDQNAIPYMEETTQTNAAAGVAEKGDYPESALAFTQKSSPVQKIATFLPITDEALEDVPMMQSIIDNRLNLFIRMKEETDVLGGNGTPPNLRGLMNTVGIQTQARGSDPSPDAIYKAMTLIQINSFLSASGIVMHPTNWQTIRLLKSTDGGVYLWGPPNEAGPERIWGLPVVKTTSMTLNTSLVGAFDMATQIFRKKKITIQVSNSHSDYFIKGQLAIRADERLALVVFRPAGLCTVTGMN